MTDKSEIRIVVGTLVFVLLLFGFAAVIAWGVPVRAEPYQTNEQTSGTLSRACAYKGGGGTLVDCSAGVVYSAQLAQNARYVAQAHVGAVYLRQGTAASGQDPSSTKDILLPLYSAVDVYTRSGRYLACDGNTPGASGTLHLIECQ